MVASKLMAFGISDKAARALTRALAVVAFTIGTAAAAHIAIPLPGTPVPLTLQTAVVLLAGLSLGRRDGALSQVFYLIGGALGLPFFAPLGGLAASAGYLVGFVLAAAVTGGIPARASLARAWTTAFAGSLLIFVCGVLQLKFVMMATWGQAFAMGVAPFILGDLVKVSAAATIYRLGRRFTAN